MSAECCISRCEIVCPLAACWSCYVIDIMMLRVDVAEAHYAQITVLCLSSVMGTAFWSNLFPGLGLQMKVS